MTGRLQITPEEGRRLAAARVKARIKKDQKLPGYNNHRRKSKKKKSQIVQSSPFKHKQPWNDRFFKSDEENLRNVGPLLKNDSQLSPSNHERQGIMSPSSVNGTSRLANFDVTTYTFVVICIEAHIQYSSGF